MALAPNTRLGPYEILSQIGAGGMGEVYRARDTRLDRIVAIKVLPSHVAGRDDLRQRFEREARAVSSLNHPHICALYDIGEQGGIHFLVMEYLEGETLAARLVKGALPVPEALRYGIQVADALEQAHRQGVTHRDLKPGNVMLIKSGAKLLDFGLAKLRGPQAAVAGPSLAPTQTVPLTAEGTIVGTLQYMAPEQLEGKEADARTDIFTFGALLYEMVTGRKAFEGKSQASLISAIMSSEPPPLGQLEPMSPPALDHVVKKCLAKDPEERWQSARDLADELKWIAEAGSQPSVPAPVAAARRSRQRLRWVVEGVLFVLLVVALAVAVSHFRETPPGTPTVRFSVPPPEGVTFREWYDFAVVSPDGEHILLGGETADGRGLLWIRPLHSLAAQPLAGTEGAFLPFWSPDSRYIAFFAGGKLMKIDLSGGPPQALCDLRQAGAGGTWNREGVIVFGGYLHGSLLQVPASGGLPKPVTILDASRQENHHWFPSFLPDGRHFLYLARSAKQENTGICIGSLDGKPARYVLTVDSNAVYAPPGYLLFARGQVLTAQPFDASRLRLTGDSFPVAPQVALFRAFVHGALFSVSESGVLCYRQGPSMNMQLGWFDRAGKRLGSLGDPGVYSNPALSPDEKRLAVGRLDPQANTRDIWVIDLARGTSSRLTFDPADDLNPLWSPDGSRIAFTSDRKGHRDVYQKLATGASGDEVLLESKDYKSVEDWSRDGRFIIFNVGAVTATPGVWALPVSLGKQDAARKLMPVLQGPGGPDQAQFSPDSRWIAYRSTESGRSEVYVQTFPPSGAKWQISTGGGMEPRWRGNGKELFYLAGTKLMAVEVKTSSSSFEAGIPKALFEAPVVSEERRNRYVVTADGQRFLLVTPLGEVPRPITVVLNWTAGVKR